MARTYTLTAGAVIERARFLVADKNAELGLRTSDADMLGSLNEALRAMVALAPALFSAIEPYACASGYLQTVELTRAAALLDVIGLPETDQRTLASFAPGWMSATAGAPENWMRVSGDPLRFMTYPPATAGAQVVLNVAKAPTELGALGDVVPVPEHYEPALADFVAGRAELQDDEHVDSGRAAALLERFATAIKGA